MAKSGSGHGRQSFSSSPSPSRSPPHRKRTSESWRRSGRSPSPKKASQSPPSRRTSLITESRVLLIDSLSRNVNEGHLKEIFGHFGEVVRVELAMDRTGNLTKGFGYMEYKSRADAEKARFYMDGGQIDGNVVRIEFTLRPRWRVSPPRADSPHRKPLSPPPRRSPVSRRGRSPRRPLDSSPPRSSTPQRRGCSSRRRSPVDRWRSPFRRFTWSLSKSISPRRGRASSAKRGRSSSSSDSPSSRKAPRRISMSRSPKRAERGRSPP